MNIKHWSTEEREEFDALCENAYRAGDSTAERVDEFRTLLDDARQAHRFYASDVADEAMRRGLTSILNRWHKSRSQVAVAYTFEARYFGTCPACDEPIKVGQQVRFNADDQLVHDDCTEVAPAERPVVVCDRCWLVQPCGCEDPS